MSNDPSFELNKIQTFCARTNVKSLQIVAGPGSGKTEVLAARLIYLLTVQKVPANSVVIFTFTDKAAETIKKEFNLFITVRTF